MVNNDQSIVDRFPKIIALIGIALLITGMLIENVALTFVGLTDFAAPRARTILVGISFYTFLLSPIVLPLFFYGVLCEYLTPKRIWHRCIFLAIGSLLSLTIVSSSASYFLSTSMGAAGYLAACKGLLHLYRLSPFNLFHIVLFWLPLLAIGLARLHPQSRLRWLMLPKHRKAVGTILALGFFTFPVPYALLVYPNISRSVGGGQPTVIFISQTPDADPIAAALVSISKYNVWNVRKREVYASPFTLSQQLSRLDGEILATGPLMLHRETDQFLFISDIPSTEVRNLVAIPKNQIRWYRTMQARIIFEYERVILIPDYPEAVESPKWIEIQNSMKELRKSLADRAREIAPTPGSDSVDEMPTTSSNDSPSPP